MELIKEMETCLPIPAFPSRELCQYFRGQSINMDMDTELNITEVFDSGDTGGIVCTIIKENKEVTIVSLTHLRMN